MLIPFIALTALLVGKAVNDDSYKTNTSGVRNSAGRRLMLASTR